MRGRAVDTQFAVAHPPKARRRGKARGLQSVLNKALKRFGLLYLWARKRMLPRQFFEIVLSASA